MAAVARPLFPGRRALAEVVHEGCEAYAPIGAQARHDIEDQQDVYAGVDLRMVAGRLGDTIESRQLGKQHLQGATGVQHLEEAPGLWLAEGPVELGEDPLRDQGIDLPARDHLAHEAEGLLGHLEFHAGGEARDPQEAYRVLDEGRRDVPEDPRGQIGTTAIGIY